MEILRVSEVGIDAAAAKAAAVIALGGVVVYPTDTLYGIGVNALDPEALKRMRSLKAREGKKPVSILVPTYEAIEWHAVMLPSARPIASRFFPGALTVVLPARTHLPKEVTHNGSIGIRIPDDAFSRALSMMSEYPITATSANLAGEHTPETVQDIILHFGPRIADIDLFIDDGPRKSEPASTVVSFTGDEPVVLREGAISREELGL